MSIRFDLPASVEEQLRREHVDLDLVAKEAVLVTVYRQGSITHHQLGLSLGLERHETDGLLKRHNVTEDLPRVLRFELVPPADAPPPRWRRDRPRVARGRGAAVGRRGVPGGDASRHAHE